MDEELEKLAWENLQEKGILQEMGYRQDFEPKNRIVANTYVKYKNTSYYVSTVDLGYNSLAYETKIFEILNNSDMDFNGVYQKRYPTREEALKTHDYILECFEENIIKKDRNGNLNLLFKFK